MIVEEQFADDEDEGSTKQPEAEDSCINEDARNGVSRADDAHQREHDHDEPTEPSRCRTDPTQGAAISDFLDLCLKVVEVREQFGATGFVISDATELVS